MDLMLAVILLVLFAFIGFRLGRLADSKEKQGKSLKSLMKRLGRIEKEGLGMEVPLYILIPYSVLACLGIWLSINALMNWGYRRGEAKAKAIMKAAPSVPPERLPTTEAERESLEQVQGILKETYPDADLVVIYDRRSEGWQSFSATYSHKRGNAKTEARCDLPVI